MKIGSKKNFKLFYKIIFFTLSIIFLGIIFLYFQKPSLSRDWSLDQKNLPDISFSDDSITIKNMRNFSYLSVDEYIPAYKNKNVKLDSLQSLDYIIEPFSQHDGPAHIMLSFGLDDGSYVIVSVEIRKEKGETFSPIKGLFNGYELVYMIGGEEDFVKLRANYRKNKVYMYPIKIDKKDLQDFFVSVMQRADKLTKEPEFYNTVFNNCTTNLLGHVDAMRTKKIGWKKEALFPAHSDRVLYDLGLIDTKLPLEKAREYYRIDTLSQSFVSGDYSSFIRKQKK